MTTEAVGKESEDAVDKEPDDAVGKEPDGAVDKGKKSARERVWAAAAWIGAILLIAAMIAFAVLTIFAGRAAVKRNWAEGEPWFSGFEPAPFATPVAALIAAGVAITTAKWGLASARAQRLADQTRWEGERLADRERQEDQRKQWEGERLADRERLEAERRDVTERTLRDRFHELVGLLSSHDLRAREGAAYAVAGLADDWKAHYLPSNPAQAKSEQQVCINVLIAQLRDDVSNWSPALGPDSRIEFKRSVQKIITARLSEVEHQVAVDGAWSDFDFSFDGCTLVDFSLEEQIWNGRRMSFDGTKFIGQRTTFEGFRSVGGVMSFNNADFASEETSFDRSTYYETRLQFTRAVFRKKLLSFAGVELEGTLAFEGARFRVDDVKFDGAQLSGARTSFEHAKFVNTEVSFANADIRSAMFNFDQAYVMEASISFSGAKLDSDSIRFRNGHFLAADVSFSKAQITSTTMELDDSHFIRGSLSFESATVDGPILSMQGCTFSQATITFNGAMLKSDKVDMSYVTASFSKDALSSLTAKELDTEDARFDAGSSATADCDTCEEYLLEGQ